MNKVSFFTEVQYKEPEKLPLIYSIAESYLNPFGYKAIVIRGHQIGKSKGVVYDRRKPSLCATILKIVSYLSCVPLLAALTVKTVFRQSHQFHFIDIKADIAATPEINDYLRGLLPDIINTSNWYAEGKIPNSPYKYRCKGAAYKNYSHLDPLIRAKEACLLHNLDRLKIPIDAIEIEICGPDGKKYPFLIEKCEAPNHIINASVIDIDRDYHTRLKAVVAKQLAHFYAYTGLGISGGLRNPPLDEDGNAVLFDLIEKDPRDLIFGCSGSTSNLGLINALPSIEYVDTVLAVAAKEKIKPRYKEDNGTIRATRQKEIQRHQAVREFYRQRGILDNPQLLIPENSLQTNIGKKVIKMINSCLESISDEPIVHRRRFTIPDLQAAEADYSLKGKTQAVLDQLMRNGTIYDYQEWDKYGDGRTVSFLVQA